MLMLFTLEHEAIPYGIDVLISDQLSAKIPDFHNVATRINN